MRNIVLAVLLIVTSVAYSQSYVRLGSDIVGNSTKTPVKWVQEGDFKVNITTSRDVTFYIRGPVGYTIDIDWGDGTIQRVPFSGSNNHQLLHTYSPGTYNIFFSGDVDKIQRFSSTYQPLVGTINARFKKWVGLRSFILSNCNLAGGSIENLSQVSDTILLQTYGNRVYGNLNILSKSLKQLVLSGDRQLFSGEPDSLSKELTHLSINNEQFRCVDIGKFRLKNLSKKLTQLYLWNAGDSITGSFNDLSKDLRYLSLYASSPVGVKFTGSIDSLSKKITSLYLPQGSPTVNGSFNSLPKLNYAQLSMFSVASATIDTSFRKFTFFIGNYSLNFNGNINNLLNCRYISLIGAGTLEGSIDSIHRQITNLSIQTTTGSNYSGITGKLDNLPASINTNINLQGFRVYYNGGALPAWANVTITLSCYMTESEVRNFLINWSSTAGIGSKTVNVAGTNAPIHVNQTDDPELYNAIQTLISKGKTITFNAY